MFFISYLISGYCCCFCYCHRCRHRRFITAFFHSTFLDNFLSAWVCSRFMHMSLFVYSNFCWDFQFSCSSPLRTSSSFFVLFWQKSKQTRECWARILNFRCIANEKNASSVWPHNLIIKVKRLSSWWHARVCDYKLHSR